MSDSSGYVVIRTDMTGYGWVSDSLSERNGQRGQIMTEYVNVGVVHAPGMSDMPTKVALKRAIATEPTMVSFYATDAFGPNRGKFWSTDKLDIGVKYSVVGPNPYTSRKWYATVELLDNGKITVK